MKKHDFRLVISLILAFSVFAAVGASTSVLYAQFGDDDDASADAAAGDDASDDDDDSDDGGSFSFGGDDDDDSAASDDSADASGDDASGDDASGDDAASDGDDGLSFGDDDDEDSDASGDPSDDDLSGDSANDSEDADSDGDFESSTDENADENDVFQSSNAKKAKKKVGTPNPNAPKFPSNGTKAGEAAVLTLDGIAYDFRWCPAGTFTMGSPLTEEGRELDEKCSEVKVPHGFWILETEVTLEMFRSFVKATDYKTDAERDGLGGYRVDIQTGHILPQDPTANWKRVGYQQEKTFPVTNVTWYDAQKFVEWFNSEISTTMKPEDSMRCAMLPTEVQWEYACRAGKVTRYNVGDRVTDLMSSANLRELNQNKTLMKSDEFKRNPWSLPVGGLYRYAGRVGSYDSNLWGIYDMHGNVWEWCQDGYADYELATTPISDAEGVTDLQKYVGRVGADVKNLKVIRGGGWNTNYLKARSAARGSNVPSRRFVDIGFRFVILPLEEEAAPVEEEETSSDDGGSLFGDSSKTSTPEPSGGSVFGGGDDDDEEDASAGDDEDSGSAEKSDDSDDSDLNFGDDDDDDVSAGDDDDASAGDDDDDSFF